MLLFPDPDKALTALAVDKKCYPLKLGPFDITTTSEIYQMQRIGGGSSEEHIPPVFR